ncbi:Tim10/DDP family zinc finger-domain-containing protein [Pisolithus croceorrhizus]|nr:Tim10/DDP family zinc finger-domain-containing protein [Pisolithus croceorrhizus]
MPDFFKASSHTQDSAQAGTNARKEAVMNSIRSEIALVNVQELINKATEKCFAKCVPKPGTSLTSSDEACLARCLDRYMEAFTVVSKSYTARISRESSQLRETAAEI